VCVCVCVGVGVGVGVGVFVFPVERTFSGPPLFIFWRTRRQTSNPVVHSSHINAVLHPRARAGTHTHIYMYICTLNTHNKRCRCNRDGRLVRIACAHEGGVLQLGDWKKRHPTSRLTAWTPSRWWSVSPWGKVRENHRPQIQKRRSSDVCNNAVSTRERTAGTGD
jgi:hypothetical protein